MQALRQELLRYAETIAPELEDETEDLVQDVLEALTRARAGILNPRAYAFAAIRDRCRTYQLQDFRRRSRQGQ